MWDISTDDYQILALFFNLNGAINALVFLYVRNIKAMDLNAEASEKKDSNVTDDEDLKTKLNVDNSFDEAEEDR